VRQYPNNGRLTYQLGRAYGKKGDASSALVQYRKSAEQGYSLAQYNLAVMYQEGEGVPQDYAEAMKWFRKAADQGDAHGQYGVGLMYTNGQGVPRDDAEAIKWFRKATDQALGEAQYVLGVMHKKGRGVPHDDAEAIKWYRKAADQENADAQKALAAPVATAPTSSPQPAKSSAEGGFNVGIPLFLALSAGIIWLVIYSFKKDYERRDRVRALNDERQLAMRNDIESIAAEFPFMFYSARSAGILCMDRKGERLRFVNFSLEEDGMKKVDRTVPIENVISVELSGGDEVVTDYETTSTKPDVLAGAITGGLLFGKTGAIVGATAAGSQETTVATQRVVEKPSVLVFELSDLANPVVRFSSMDHAQCDLWLHRVRSAMAQKTGHTVAA